MLKILQTVYLTYMIAFTLWRLLGVLSITGWIKPTGITRFDQSVDKAEAGTRENWEYAGQWFGRAGLIMLICLFIAVFLFVVSSVVLKGFAEMAG